ncbi:MAG: Ltp family lipoprotein [Janibacter sp.]
MSQQPQWQPTNPPIPPVQHKSWFARHKALSIVLGVLLVVVLGCCGTGMAAMSGDTEGAGDTPSTQESTESAKEATKEPSTSKSSSTDTATESKETQEAEPEKEEPAEPEMTTEQENAIRAAENYLDFMPFSKQGLIDQLSSDAGDGYPQDVAEFAVDNIEVDYNEQAKKAAKNYTDTMPFSKQGLIDQLSSDAGDGYTREQAEYGANQVM